MKAFTLLLALALGGALAPAIAQPSIDPAFTPAEIYRPADIAAVLQLSSGARLLAGSLVKADGQLVNSVVRYSPNGTLDAAFAANVAAYQWQPNLLAEAPGGKLLVATNNGRQLQLSAGTFTSLARLNADGTVDNSFAASVQLNGDITSLLAQPDGKVVVGGDFTALNGQPVANLVRLNADGTPDAAFQAAGAGPERQVNALALQPDGKLLVGGRFITIRGQAAAQLVRLLPGGGIDASFTRRTSSWTAPSVDVVALQPDGKVLISGSSLADFGPGGLIRLTATGALDNSFQVTSLPNGSSFNQLQVQADGRILAGRRFSNLVRLLTTGANDASFQLPAGLATLSDWQLLPTGQLLVANSQLNGEFATATYVLSVGLLTSNGARDPSFEPHLQNTGFIWKVLVQADGKIVVGGILDEVNGTAAHGLVRLLASGAVDASYTPQAAVGTVINSLVLQPDGKLLAGGTFARLGGSPRPGVARLLPSGAADATFAPPTPTTGLVPEVRQLALQPDGKLLVVQYGANGFFRLTATGQPDSSFQPATGVGPTTLLVQPDGNILTAGFNYIGGVPMPLVRLLPTGALDPTFTPPLNPQSFVLISALARYADGRILVGGEFRTLGTGNSSAVARLLPNGAPDPAFTSTLRPFAAFDIAIQPNQRVLVGGHINASAAPISGTARLLADGSLDASYAPAQGPGIYVYSLAIQPDGKILAAGNFTTVSGLPITSLVRLVDPNVLSVKANDHAPALTAWPVPAREALHVQLDATAQPQRVQLLDALGRAVRTQAANSAALTLPTAGLAPGVYLLRVEYASGAATRRVVVE